MALPKINETPMYPVTIPSTGMNTRFRPYVVKEEKVLLMALESQIETDIANAILDIVVTCIEENIDRRRLTLFDIEYLFLQIRSKSVGESAQVLMSCAHCEQDTQVSVTLSDVEPPKDVANKNIQLTETVSVTMSHLSFDAVATIPELHSPDSVAELLYNSVLRSMHSVNTDEERLMVQDEPFEEVVKFVDSLTADQFNKLRAFVENTPQIKKDIEWDCQSCGKPNKYTLQGLTDFFG